MTGTQSPSSPLRITDEQKEQYHEEGFFLLERALPDEWLAMLREECDRYIAEMDAQMEARGVEVDGITHKRKRYFIGNKFHENARMREYLFSDLTAGIVRATVGETAYLFGEQFVVKLPEVGMPFAWHQDSGYIGHDHKPYLSIWTALDDVNEENGTVYVLPYSRAGTKEWRPHTQQEGTNDMIGYFGDDPGLPVVLPAGGMAIFSSTTFHRSSANTSDRMRRIYLAQYSPEPIQNKEGTGLWGNAAPFLRDGKRVA